MLDWQDFDAVFSPKTDYAYDTRTVESIIKHRKEFGDQLFFDRIWKLIGLTRPARSNYPPRTNTDLRNLWSKICQSSASPEQKLALLYYLLRDCRQLPSADANFARRVHLQPQWQLLMAGLWELDHAQFNRALEHLTDPSLTPTFSDEILLSLLQHPRCDPSLASAYYMAVSPPLAGQPTLDAYFGLVMQNNVVEAFYFAQKQQESRHKLLFEKLIVAVLQAKPDQTRADRAALLAGLPLTAQEELWWEECLQQGAASTLSGAADTLMARRIGMQGPVNTSNGPSVLKGDTIGGISWATISAGIAAAMPH